MGRDLNDEIERALSTAPEMTRATGPAATVPEPVIHRLSDVEPEPIDWLWPGRFAIGKLSLIQGDPGLGKSIVSLDIAARVSAGASWPDRPEETRAPAGVVLLNAEDDIADTVRPRLDAAGAAVSRIVAFDAVRMTGVDGAAISRSPDLARDLVSIEQAIDSTHNCRLIVVDPITAYLGQTDSHKNSDIRGLLAPFGQLAARRRLAIIAVTHMNKNTAGPAVHRTSGSLAFPAAARAVWLVARDREDDDRRLFLPVKNNIAADRTGLAYRVEASGGGTTPSIMWESGEVTTTADDALGGETPRVGDAVEEASAWLRDMLVNGPQPAVELKARAKADGIQERTLRRAKAALGVQAEREGYSSGGRWVWAMPPPERPEAKGGQQTERWDGCAGRGGL